MKCKLRRGSDSTFLHRADLFELWALHSSTPLNEMQILSFISSTPLSTLSGYDTMWPLNPIRFCPPWVGPVHMLSPFQSHFPSSLYFLGAASSCSSTLSLSVFTVSEGPSLTILFKTYLPPSPFTFFMKISLGLHLFYFCTFTFFSKK